LVELDNKLAHIRRFQQFSARSDLRSSAFATVGGGDVDRIGFTEMRILMEHASLADARFVIDVGCGPGRLARYLTEHNDLKLLGTDVVPDLLEVARSECCRPDWDFLEVSGFGIPAETASADLVAIFSVMTNIFPEHSYLLVQEAARVLRPGGKLVTTYLDISARRHWSVFRDLSKHSHTRIDPLVFLDASFLSFFAEDSGMRIAEHLPPDAVHANAPLGSRLLDGRSIEGPLSLGQTICVLEKP
jgi:SAM-dependent methyltransferase